MTINKEQPVSDAMIYAGMGAEALASEKSPHERVSEIYLAMKAASHPLEQQQAVSGGMVERVARALCEQDGYDPEYLEPGDDPYQERDGMPSPCIDGYNRKDEPCHFMWRRYDLAARAALTASGMGRMEAVREHLRVTMIERPVTEENNTYSDGFGRGLGYAIRQIDTALQEEGVEQRA